MDPLGERVARIEARLDTALPTLQEDMREIKDLLKDKLADYDERLRSLEGWRMRVIGIAATVAVIAQYAVRSILDWLRGQ